MRQMKYLKLFEAFESVQLSKTLKFVKKEDRNRFLEDVKSICKKLDAPLSSLSDDFFQYLPYTKAVKLKAGAERLECTSCKGVGKVSKTWGSGVRMMKCTKCEGSGTVEPQAKTKYIKFWFDSEGSYVATTLVDGRYHADKRDETNYVKKDITKDTKELSAAEMKSKYKIVNGETRLYIQNLAVTGWRRSGQCSQLAIAFIDRDGRLYAVHGNSNIDYGTPTGRKWKDYGRYSTNMKSAFSEERNAGAKVFLMTDVEEKEDIYWNAPVSIDRYGVDTNVAMSKSILKDAHFAIVFDYDSFAYGGKEWNPVSITQQDRKEARKGAAALVSDEEIRNANIERYIKTISNIDLSEGIEKLVNKVPMIFGGDLALYFIYVEKNFIKFKNMMSDVYDFMSANNDEERKKANERIASRLVDARDSTNSVKERIVSRIANTKSSFAESDDKEKYDRLFDRLETLSKSINQKLLKSSMETIEDMEIMLMKVVGINSALRSDRFALDYYLRSYIADLDNTGWRGDNAAMNSMRNLSVDNIDEQIRKLDFISNVIQRL